MSVDEKIKKMEEAYEANKDVIESLLTFYDTKADLFEHVGFNVFSTFSKSKELKPYRHSISYRVKERDHFKDKLLRKSIELQTLGKPFEITPDNIYSHIQDFVGVRILHIHTDQIVDILRIVKSLLEADRYQFLGNPVANIWDLKYKSYYEGLGFEINERKKSMYTSVHLIISSFNTDNTPIELQIRTLSEELWGEVSHKVNYPHDNENPIIDDNLEILARITSASTRLVDTIYKIHSNNTNV